MHQGHSQGVWGTSFILFYFRQQQRGAMPSRKVRPRCRTRHSDMDLFINKAMDMDMDMDVQQHTLK